MATGSGFRGSGLAMAVACLGLLVPVGTAGAADIIAPQSNPPKATDGWQAGTCTSDLPECSVDTKGQFFKLGAGHPQVGFT